MESLGNQNYLDTRRYDPSWTSPLNMKRSTTNPWMLIPFILVLLNWIGVAIYAFSKGDLWNNDIWSDVKESLKEETFFIVGAWIFTIALSLTFVVFLRISARRTFCAYTIAFLLMAYLTLGYLFYALSQDAQTAIVVLTTFLVMSLIIISYGCAHNRKFIPMAGDGIQETIKAIYFFPSLSLCLLLLYSLTLVTIGFCLALGACFATMTEEQAPFLPYYGQFSNVVGCAWITFFLFAFFRVVISGTYGTWYWTRDKQEIPKFTPMRFIWITLRYHAGSVIAGSLITPIGQFIQAMGLSHTDFADPKEGIDKNRCGRFFQRCYNRIGMIGDQAYVYTALHGQGFCQSAKSAFYIWRRNHTKVVVMEQLIRELVFVGFITISSLSVNLYLSAKYISCGLQSQMAMTLVLFFIYLLINSIFLLVDAAMDTVLICGLEDFEVNGNSARPHYMSDKLKKIILENKME